MLFHSQYYRDKSPLSFSMGGELVEQVVVFRYLGVWMDSRLNFTEHITVLCSTS